MLDLNAAFNAAEDEFLKFDRIESPPHPRRDLYAFLLLDQLVPNPGRCMIAAAEHDEIYLDTDCEKLAEVATQEDIVTLVRCGVMHDDGGLSMYT